MGLTRDQILAKRQAKPAPIFTEELGAGFIKRFSALEALEWSQYVESATDETGKIAHPDIYRAKLVQLSYCDENGTPMFTRDDVTAISQTLSYATIAQIFIESCRVNCLTYADTRSEIARAKDFFLTTRPSGSGTGSAPSSNNPTSTGSSSP